MGEKSKLGPVRLRTMEDVQRAMGDIATRFDRLDAEKVGSARGQSFSGTRSIALPVGVATEVGRVASPRSGVVLVQGSLSLAGTGSVDATVRVVRANASRTELAQNTSAAGLGTIGQAWFPGVFGGNAIGPIPAYFEAWGVGSSATWGASGAGVTRLPLPAACTIRAVAWNTATADGTTHVRLLDNGAQIADWTLTGATGVISGLAIAVAAGHLLDMYFSAGTVPNQSVFVLQLDPGVSLSGVATTRAISIQARDQTPDGSAYLLVVTVAATSVALTASDVQITARTG